MDVYVRQANLKDTGPVFELINVLARSAGGESQVTHGYIELFLSAKGCGILLAEKENEIMGFLSYTFRPNLYHAAETCMVEEMVVNDKYRGRSIGKMLLGEIIKIAEKRGCAEIAVTAKPDAKEEDNGTDY